MLPLWGRPGRSASRTTRVFRLCLVALLGVVVVWAEPEPEPEVDACTAGVTLLRENGTFSHAQDRYYELLTVGPIRSSSGTIHVDSAASEAYKAACLGADADWCDGGGSISIKLFSNATESYYHLDGSISLCFPPACCDSQVCNPDPLSPWISLEMARTLSAFCSENPDLCAMEPETKILLSEDCRDYSVLEAVLMVGVFIGTGVLACACVAAMCRAMYTCCRGGDPRAAYVPLGSSSAAARESMRNRLLADHVREYDLDRDQERGGDACAICLEAWGPGCEVHEFGGHGGCGHLFHAKCIVEWLRHKDNCPVCRSPWDAV